VDKDKFASIADKMSEKSMEMLLTLDELIHESLTTHPTETRWSYYPVYSIGERSLMLSPFKTHITICSNAPKSCKAEIFPNAILAHRDELKGYEITPKGGMLKIKNNQEIPKEVFIKIVKETFGQL